MNHVVRDRGWNSAPSISGLQGSPGIGKPFWTRRVPPRLAFRWTCGCMQVQGRHTAHAINAQGFSLRGHRRPRVSEMLRHQARRPGAPSVTHLGHPVICRCPVRNEHLVAGIVASTRITHPLERQDAINVAQFDRAHFGELLRGVMPSVVIFDHLDMVDVVRFFRTCHLPCRGNTPTGKSVVVIARPIVPAARSRPQIFVTD